MEKNHDDARAPKGPSPSDNPQPGSFERSKLDALVEEIARLLEEGEARNWQIGDLLVEAFSIQIDGKRPTYAVLKERYEPLRRHSISYLSQLRTTAQDFSLDDRKLAAEKGATWHECYEARRSREAAVKRGLGTKSEPLGDHLDAVLAQKENSRVDARALTKRRVRIKTERNQADRARLVALAQKANEAWLQNCHPGSCLDVLRAAEDRSVALVWADPPYWGYDKFEDGHLAAPYNGAVLSECDNGTTAAALPLTIEVIREAARVMADTSALVLFQSAQEPDHPEVVSVAREVGFKFIRPAYWNKKTPQPADFRQPFSVQTERILVMARSSRSFYDNEDRSGRTDILDEALFEKLYGDPGTPPGRAFYRSRRDGIEPGTIHQMEKPRVLCRYYLERLTRENDLVLDLFGCSGSMACECIALDRRWKYSETNEANYNLGLSRLRAAASERVSR